MRELHRRERTESSNRSHNGRTRQGKAVSLEELMVSTLALAKLLSEKSLITYAEFKQNLIRQHILFRRAGSDLGHWPVTGESTILVLCGSYGQTTPSIPGPCRVMCLSGEACVYEPFRRRNRARDESMLSGELQVRFQSLEIDSSGR
jgi:hypothetical protein